MTTFWNVQKVIHENSQGFVDWNQQGNCVTIVWYFLSALDSNIKTFNPTNLVLQFYSSCQKISEPPEEQCACMTHWLVKQATLCFAAKQVGSLARNKHSEALPLFILKTPLTYKQKIPSANFLNYSNVPSNRKTRNKTRINRDNTEQHHSLFDYKIYPIYLTVSIQQRQFYGFRKTLHKIGWNWGLFHCIYVRKSSTQNYHS